MLLQSVSNANVDEKSASMNRFVGKFWRNRLCCPESKAEAVFQKFVTSFCLQVHAIKMQRFASLLNSSLKCSQLQQNEYWINGNLQIYLNLKSTNFIIYYKLLFKTLHVENIVTTCFLDYELCWAAFPICID